MEGVMHSRLFATGMLNILSRTVFLAAFVLLAPPAGRAADRNDGSQDRASIDPSTILPVSLGVPADCLDSSPRAMNNGAYPVSLVVGGASNCAGKYLPQVWRNGTWTPVDLPTGVLCVLSLALLLRWKVNPTWLVLGGAAAVLLRMMLFR
jgi:hypothetical protein